MYSVYIDNHLLWSPSLANEGYVILNPSVKFELNKAPSFSCIIAQENPNADKIVKLKGELTVWEDENRIFRGRVISSNKDFYGQISIQAEGDINFLNDVALRPYSHTVSVEVYLRKLIHEYNQHVDTEKRFGAYDGAETAENLDFGRCTVTDNNNNIVRSNSEYTPILDEINNKLLKLLGGYIFTRFDATSGITYIDYLAVSGEQDTSQIIQFGENLLDLSESLSAGDVYTVIVPLGAKPEGSGNDAQRLTIADAVINGTRWGTDYIENQSAINRYGRIERIVTWDDVTVAENLWAKGNALIQAQGTEIDTIDVDAVDLHLMGLSASSMKYGNYYRIASYPHGFLADTWLQLAKVTLNLMSVSKNKYSFTTELKSNTFASASRQTAENTSAAATVANTAASAASAAATALQKVGNDYSQETGMTTSGWIYRKWHSGVCDCRVVGGQHNVTANGQYGSLYRYYADITFPFEFVNFLYTVNLSPVYPTLFTVVGIEHSATTGFRVHLASASDALTQIYADIMAYGFWK